MQQTSIKVLHVIHSSKGGGAETQLDILCRYGEAEGIISTTFCVKSAKELNADIRTYIQYERTRKFDFGLFPAISNAIRETQPDLVHIWLPPVITIPAIVACQNANVPFITSIRNSKRFLRLLDILEYVLSWMFGKGIISNTPIELCSFLYKWLFQRKCGVVIPNAVDLSEQTKAPLSASESDNTFNIIFVGRIIKQKNLACLIRAMSAAQNDNWRLTICGAGSLEEDIRYLIRTLNLTSQVNWLGFRSDIRHLMHNHDVLVLPSLYEGFPNVLLEAMAVGLPAVVSDIPPHRAILGDTGSALTFPPKNHKELASTLEQLEQSHMLRKDLARKGLEIAMKYSVDQLVRRHADYYREALSR